MHAILPASISWQTGLSALRQQRAVHDVNINISFLKMAERARQSANDLETELLPKMDCRRVRRNHKIELHGAKAHSTGLAQTMLRSEERRVGKECRSGWSSCE